MMISGSHIIANVSFFFDFQFHHHASVYVGDRHHVSCQNARERRQSFASADVASAPTIKGLRMVAWLECSGRIFGLTLDSS